MKLVVVVGTRPNFVKAAPFIHEALTKKIGICLVHTGQHYDKFMSGVFFKDLNLPKPDYYLNVGGESPEKQVKRIVKLFSQILEREKHDMVVIIGDVRSSYAAAMAAHRFGSRVAHIEAGNRSFDKTIPEEVNRVFIDNVSDYCFVSDLSGMENLEKENLKAEKYFVGNIMIDTIVSNLKRIKKMKNSYKKNSYGLVTLHRVNNVELKKDLSEVTELLNYVAEKYIRLVFPVHPHTLKNIKKYKIKIGKKIELIKPAGYLLFQKLIYDSKFALTDSGGMLAETTYYGKPCLFMRSNNENPGAFKSGSAVLVGRNKELIRSNIEAILNGKFKKGKIPKFWDGKTSGRIISILQCGLPGYQSS